jgi:hypothetical protein
LAFFRVTIISTAAPVAHDSGEFASVKDSSVIIRAVLVLCAEDEGGDALFAVLADERMDDDDGGCGVVNNEAAVIDSCQSHM